ncbi:MAG: CopG family transcriptional regulator [Solirubrobacteraceae bacterium]
MRTTVTLDPDVAAKLKQLARERDVSFKVALNDAVRAGVGRGVVDEKPYRMKSRSMGIRPGFNIDKALTISGQLEDEEVLRKYRRGQ